MVFQSLADRQTTSFIEFFDRGRHSAWWKWHFDHDSERGLMVQLYTAGGCQKQAEPYHDIINLILYIF
jgi:hypothetical protein